MEVVANHLFQEVLKRTDQAEKNLFGRSAFNRCYYATFLNVHAGLKQLDPKWSELSHKAIPDLLKGSIRKELAKGRDNASKVSDVAVVQLCARAVSAAYDLSDLMKIGYATRVVADYYPEIQISIPAGQECSLNSVGAKDAKSWSIKSAGYVSTIVAAWNQIHA